MKRMFGMMILVVCAGALATGCAGISPAKVRQNVLRDITTKARRANPPYIKQVIVIGGASTELGKVAAIDDLVIPDQYQNFWVVFNDLNHSVAINTQQFIESAIQDEHRVFLEYRMMYAQAVSVALFGITDVLTLDHLGFGYKGDDWEQIRNVPATSFLDPQSGRPIGRGAIQVVLEGHENRDSGLWGAVKGVARYSWKQRQGLLPKVASGASSTAGLPVKVHALMTTIGYEFPGNLYVTLAGKTCEEAYYMMLGSVARRAPKTIVNYVEGEVKRRMGDEWGDLPRPKSNVDTISPPYPPYGP